MGGQSAVGTKAGDLFTRVTIVVATFWIILCMITVRLSSGTQEEYVDPGMGGAAEPAQGVQSPPADGEASE